MTSEQLFQYATVKIKCNDEIGSALVYSPDESLDYLYILTAKHCLVGKKFDKSFVNTDIEIQKIYNPATGVWHSLTLTETDISICSTSNISDIALLIIPKNKMLELSGMSYPFQVVEKAGLTNECIIRGFAEFNSGQDDRPYAVEFEEECKDKPGVFQVKFDGSLDTRHQSAVANVQGLSGGGLFAAIKGTYFLYGITHTYEEKNSFFATKVTAYNYLIPASYASINFIHPEENDAIIKSFELIEVNREALKVRTSNTIGNITVTRDFSGAKTIIEQNRMTVFHGNAGVGKSAMAKALIADLEKNADCFVIAFTAEQLFSASLNEALVKAKYEADINQLIGSPLSRKRVVFWIESFEKLIEAGYAGAFKELLALVKSNARLAVVVTIRDYFLQKFKILYGYELPSPDIFCHVQEFNDDEIAIIREHIPAMQPLFTNTKLYHLLRTPYYLDKAVRIYPQLLAVANLDEAEFKKLMWQEIVEAGDLERGAVFSTIALQRAKEMSLFTFSLPGKVTSALVGDNILQVEQGELANRFAPAHDILEDWALIRYIKQQRQDAETPEALIENLDNSPAIRRAFRLWLEEFYRQQPKEADNFSSSILLNQTVEQSWKDEMVVYVLRSENAVPLFKALKVQLLEDKGKMLSHFIHLLKTCCRALRTGTYDFDDLVPAGAGWDACINFIAEYFEAISQVHELEYDVISLILDWGRQLPAYNPRVLPPAAKSAALLLLAFLWKYQGQFDHYRRKFSSTSPEHEALKLLFKLTSVVQTQVAKLINAAAALPSAEDDYWTDKNFLMHVRNYLIDGVVADQACKYFPDVVISLANNKWKEKEKVRQPGSLMSYIRVEHGPDYWGLEEHIDYDYYQASAYQTSFYWLFLHHPNKAISFLLDFLNTAYVKNQEGRPRNGDQWQNITLTFDGYGERTYYGSYDYWAMYRGFSGHNKVVQSLLMGLEKGLLELAASDKSSFEQIQIFTKRLILETNNVSVLAVVSSVFQAYPEVLNEISVMLLGNRALFEWDGTRYSTEMSPIGGYYGDDWFLGNERIKSNTLKHRLAHFRGLIGFVAHYMFYYQAHKTELFKQVDGMWAKLMKNDVYWKKALTDMDARKYEFKPVEIPGYEQYVQLVPNYDADVAQIVLSYQSENVMPNIGTVWASNVYEGKVVEDNSYSAWKRGYEYLLKPQGGLGFMTSPGTMACVALRDYFTELNKEEQEWCREQIITLAKKQLAPRSQDSFMDLDGGLFDKNAVLYGLPLIFKLPFDISVESDVKQLIFSLLISKIESEPKQHLMLSISENLWKTRPAFAMNCWYGLLKFIQKSKVENAKNARGYSFDPYTDEEFDDVVQSVENELNDWVQELILEVASETPNPIGAINPQLDRGTRWYLDDVLRIIPKDTDIRTHQQFIADMMTLHLNHLGNANQRDSDDFSDSRNIFKFFYARYLLSRPDAIAEKLLTELLNRTLVISHGVNNVKVNEYIYEIVKQIISAINNWASLTQPTDKFWFLWGKLRDWIILTQRAFMIPLFLLDLGWNKEVDNWHILEGKTQFYKDFIMVYGFNHINVSIDLISGVGFREFMPDSISWVAFMLTSNRAHLAKTDKLEKLVHRAFFNYSAAIKSNKQLIKDFIFILDFLIVRGSPKAYMLKEEMIQYK